MTSRLPSSSSSFGFTGRQLSTSAPSKSSKSSKPFGASKPVEISTSPYSHASVESKDPLSSSPIFTRSHPFLRKYQSISISIPSATPFSTTATMKKIGKSSSSSVHGSAPPSPSAAAANATEALFEKRLHECMHKQHHGQNSCDCDSRLSSISDYSSHYGSDDESIDFDPLAFPPISDEAQRFTEQLLGQNKEWAERMDRERPGFFAKLEKQQKPQVLWIANQIVNLDPGEVFVHRNIANVVTHTDMNVLSVLEYAVDVLKVRHIIVCGHYGCGGVAASLTQKNFGVIDNWLRNIKDLYTIHRKKFDKLPSGSKEQQDLLTELNVIQSALNVCHTSTIQKAWARGAEISIHAWCYRLNDGKIRNLGLCIEGPGATEDVYHVEKP
ncbi:hypothetical protein BGW41_008201 [Actinomortierella wolfii]|nr:hypothetical protein BGW41_008201 [Actinomortierella wolfii]